MTCKTKKSFAEVLQNFYCFTLHVTVCDVTPSMKFQPLKGFTTRAKLFDRKSFARD